MQSVLLRFCKRMGKRIALLRIADGEGHPSAARKKGIPRHAGRPAAPENENVGLMGFNASLLDGAQHAQTIRDMADHAPVPNFNGVHRAANLCGLVNIIQKRKDFFLVRNGDVKPGKAASEKRPSPNRGVPAEQ